MIPSSRYLVNNLLSRIDWPNAKVIVEYGPGIGNMTQEILKRMRPDAMLIAIEMNPEFVRFLESEFRDPRLRVVCGSASDVRNILAKLNLDRADYVISGIPYTTIPAPVRRRIRSGYPRIASTRGRIPRLPVHADGTSLPEADFRQRAAGL